MRRDDLVGVAIVLAITGLVMVALTLWQ